MRSAPRATLARRTPCWLLALAAGLPATAPAGEGQAVYQQVCIACHQTGALGAPGLAPPLVGTLAARAARPAVREYLAAVLTHGLQGRIVAEGQSYNSVMPSQAQLSDAALASVLTHVVQELAGQTAVPAFEPAELARARAGSPSPKALRAQRDAARAP